MWRFPHDAPTPPLAMPLTLRGCLGGILGSLGTQLQSFDVVIVRPQGLPAAAAAATAAATGTKGSTASAVPGKETAGRLVDQLVPPNEEEAVMLRTQTGMDAGVPGGGGSGLALPRVENAPREGAGKAGLRASGEAPPGSSSPEEGGMTITVRASKRSVADLYAVPNSPYLFCRLPVFSTSCLRASDFLFVAPRCHVLPLTYRSHVHGLNLRQTIFY